MIKEEKLEQTALVKWEPKAIALRLNTKAERKREELLRSIQEGLLHDPISILIAVGISAAVSAGGYAVSRMFAPKQKPQRVGQLTGNVQLQNSEQGLFIPEIYGGSPSFSPSAGANPVPQNVANGTSNGSGGFSKTSGGGTTWNGGMSHNVQINEGDNAFIRFRVGTGYACAGFSTIANPTSGNSDFKFGLQWNPPDHSVTLKYNNTLLLAGASVYEDNTTEFTVELRDGRFRMYKGPAEIIPQNFTFPTPAYPMWLGIGLFSLGAGMTECKVLVGPDIGPPPNAGAGGVKVPFILIWTSGLRKVETPVQQQTGGGKGHAPTETVIQISYNLDAALMAGRGPLNLVREYANADIILNQDPNLSAATGVYDPTVGGDTNYPLDTMPDPHEGYVRPFNRLDGELDPLNPGDPGEGSGGIVQGGASATNVYPGSTTQLPDPTIEADIDGKFGPGSTPAFRGKAYIVHNTFKLDRWQGIVPNFVGVWEHQTLKTLNLIFASFCQREGMSSGDYDFAGLSTALPVRGLKIDGGRYSPAAVMDSPELQAMFNYFTTEGGGKVLGFVNGTEPSIFIPESDFGWVDGESENQDIVQTITPTVEKESSKPKLVEVKFVHPGDDWDISMQLDQRRNTDGKEKKTIEVNVTALPEEARAAAQRVLYQDYVAGTKYEFTLPWTYVFLYPGYRITTTTSEGFSYSFRLLSINGGIGLMDCEAVALEVSAFSQTGVSHSVPDYNPGQTIPTMTVAAYLNLPARNASERVHGMLVAGCPRTNVGQAYRGFTVWSKQNNQQVSLATIVGVAVVGRIVSHNALSTDSTAVDNTGEIVVDLYNTGFLSSVPQADMIAGANRGAFGDLICGFADADQDPAFPNRWTLSTLLNGQSNTFEHIGEDLVGKPFVLLDDAVKFVPLREQDLNSALVLRAVTFGQSLIDAAEVSFTYTGQNLRYDPPTDIQITKDASSDWIIKAFVTPEPPNTMSVEIWPSADKSNPADRKRTLIATTGTTQAALLASSDGEFDPIDETFTSTNHAFKNNFAPAGGFPSGFSGTSIQAIDRPWQRFDFEMAFDNYADGSFISDLPSAPLSFPVGFFVGLHERANAEAPYAAPNFADCPLSIEWLFDPDGIDGTVREVFRSYNTIILDRTGTDAGGHPFTMVGGEVTDDAIHRPGPRYSFSLNGGELAVYQNFVPGGGNKHLVKVIPPALNYPLRLSAYIFTSDHFYLRNVMYAGATQHSTIYAKREQIADFGSARTKLFLRLYKDGLVVPGVPIDIETITIP